MEALVHWFSQNLSQYISPEGAVFIISMIPLLELRGGLLAASLLKISAAKAIPLCIVGNIIPIPFILLFIRQIFKVLKKTKLFRGLVMKLEDRAMRKSDQVKKYEFWGLMLFVGIPLPGTGAWTGSLIASLLEIDIKKSSLAIFCGIIMATIRFADVLLMQSELKQDATGLNKVRARSHLAPVAYSLEAIKQERRWELAFESIRWWDILRWSGSRKREPKVR